MDSVSWQIITALLAVFLAWNGFLIWIIKYLIERALKGGDRRINKLEEQVAQMDEKFGKTIDQEADKRRDLEREFREFNAQLPLLYVHREDWIRLATTIEAKMDSLNNKFDNVKDRINARN